ncbi:upstream stimulatory factor 2 isoform X2 [Phlebotomus argentipes]|uniref:upstream stimulatory factor 2 isoform X2 n=1 Tax=Phlebotomus argentipes TaxID=94469 RepID=UPI002893513A|nr:upstream stimulatory factor 2 isoform X2 [Phlebotomus argentipes]
MSFKISDLDNSVTEGDNDLMSIVDENSIGASQDTLNAGDENAQYTSIKSENGLVTYRLVHLGESESNLQSAASSATTPSSNMSQQCQVYVIGNPSNFLQAQRNTPTKSEVVVSPVIQHTKRDERRRATHNEVERRRRDKINNWILKLSKIIPPDPTEVPRSGCGNLEGQSKGGILAKACEYIMELKEATSSLKDYQTELKRLVAENKSLREKNESLIRDNEMLKAQVSGVKSEGRPTNL